MPPPITLLERQREALAQALADAVAYRDPPLYCNACEARQGTLGSSVRPRLPVPACTSLSAAR